MNGQQVLTSYIHDAKMLL
jgi:hypothetical protein